MVYINIYEEMISYICFRKRSKCLNTGINGIWYVEKMILYHVNNR